MSGMGVETRVYGATSTVLITYRCAPLTNLWRLCGEFEDTKESRPIVRFLCILQTGDCAWHDIVL